MKFHPSDTNQGGRIQDLTEVTGATLPATAFPEREDRIGYYVTCTTCGDLPSVASPLDPAYPMTIIQAGLLQRRHLAEHLTALADEIQEASK